MYKTKYVVVPFLLFSEKHLNDLGEEARITNGVRGQLSRVLLPPAT